MTNVMEELADSWEAQGHPRSLLSFAGTPSLARQLAAGSPADVMISADAEWMDWLEEHALIDSGSRSDIAGNVLVYVVREPVADGSVPVPSNGGKLAMADPDSVPAGRYGKAAMIAAGLWDGVAASVVPAENVRAALQLVERGEAEAAIVYASDAAASEQVTAIAFPHALPDGMTIRYPAALVAGAIHPDAAGFLASLSSEEAKRILCAHGFTLPEGQQPC